MKYLTQYSNLSLVLIEYILETLRSYWATTDIVSCYCFTFYKKINNYRQILSQSVIMQIVFI